MRRAESIKILRRAIEGGLLDDLGWRWWWVLDRTPDLFVETRERLAGVAPEFDRALCFALDGTIDSLASASGVPGLVHWLGVDWDLYFVDGARSRSC